MPSIFAVVVVIALLVIAVVISLSILVTFTLIGLVLHLFMAGLVGALADAIVPGKLPYGWFGAILAGLIGSWLGVRLLGHLGPELFNVPIIPGFVGAVILAFAISLLARAVGGGQARSI